MRTFKLSITDKKELVKRLEALTGMKARYTYMPRCAYECGLFTVEKNGDLVVEDGAEESILQTLLDEGMVIPTEDEPAEATEEIEVETDAPAETTEEATEDTMQESGQENVQDEDETETVAETAEANATEDTEPAATEEPTPITSEEPATEQPTESSPEGQSGEVDTLTISMPLSQHTAESLHRLINLIYSRGSLLSKSTGGTFGVDRELLTAIDEAGIITSTADFITLVNEHGGLTGLTFEDGKVNFTGFPMTEDPKRVDSFMKLASLMNRHAIEMKRILAKKVNEENEKYAFRIWLIRIGMNTDEYKGTRKLLMENLSGHTAFRNKAEEEKWKARQKAKRDALRAAKAAEDTAETTADQTAEDADEGAVEAV